MKDTEGQGGLSAPGESEKRAAANRSSDSTLTLGEADSSTQPSVATGEPSLGRWGPLKVLERVGKGGFGETFRARDVHLDREVALKLLRPGGPQAEARGDCVIREGALLARVRQQNVVIVHGADRHGGRVGVWMEFIEGRTLETLLQEHGPFSERKTALIGIDLCRALAAVHRAGIIHRDIKTGNVMLEGGGRIVLVDFGLGLDMRYGNSRTAAGTPPYIAPELLAGEPATVHSDLYSLGVLLFHLVTGGYPVSGRTVRDLCEAHDRGQVTRLGDARTDLSCAFIRVVERCLSREPGGRFPDAESLRGALELSRVDLTGYLRGRIAEWRQPRYRLDKEFVALTLLVDQGEESTEGRWRARPERYHDLGEVLKAVADPALVLLGPPGSGKSTLLRRHEMDRAEETLADLALADQQPPSERSSHPVTFFIQFNNYRPSRPGGPLPAPDAWLAERWQARFPELPPLPALLDAGRMVLLLDGLNEMAALGRGGPREAVVLWKRFLDRLVDERPGNRVIFSCRTLDYSAPLSTASLRVPQVVIEPMTDEQVEEYLDKHDPDRGAEIWSQLKGTPQLEVMRSPYFLSLLVEQIQPGGEIAKGHAGLFTGFVREALRREVERDNPLFAPDGLLTERDVRRVAQGLWKTPWELPERGVLISKLSDLAFGMQTRSEDGGSSQVLIGYREALDLLDDDRDEEIVKAGEALLVLDEDAAGDEVKFFHQLVQEFFAGRRFARSPEPERVRVPWRSKHVAPPLAEVLSHLHPAETLPPLQSTGWEEAVLMAGAMSADPDGFVRGLMKTNLALASRCADQPEVLPRLSAGLLNQVRRALVERSRERRADLRARIEAGLILGPLGDPRFERCKGPHGDYLMPPMIQIPGGQYYIGEPILDEQVQHLSQRQDEHLPRHEVRITAFWIGQFPVTNAEWALFAESGAYEDERWWDDHAIVRYWIERRAAARAEWSWQEVTIPLEYQAGVKKRQSDERRRWKIVDGHRLERLSFGRRSILKAEKLGLGGIGIEFKQGAMKRPELDESHLKDLVRRNRSEGAFWRRKYTTVWRDAKWDNPSQPVVGVRWLEARAYANWLSAQTGQTFRLPTEAEWEAAARGYEGRLYAYGKRFDPLSGNTVEARIGATTPVGVFVEGDTPEGVSDLTGNVDEWTDDGHGAVGVFEDRVLRGGSFRDDRIIARAAHRRVTHAMNYSLEDHRKYDSGFRLAAGSDLSLHTETLNTERHVSTAI